MTKKKFENLEQLLGCYFHQDWADEFNSTESALQSIVESAPKDAVLAGVDEINLLLATSLPESDLGKLLTNQIGCYFDPSSEGLTYAEWLQQVREKFLLSVS